MGKGMGQVQSYSRIRIVSIRYELLRSELGVLDSWEDEESVGLALSFLLL